MLPLKPKPQNQHRQTHKKPKKTPDYIAGLGATVQGIRPWVQSTMPLSEIRGHHDAVAVQAE
jgi:hypothetical protein